MMKINEIDKESYVYLGCPSERKQTNWCGNFNYSKNPLSKFSHESKHWEVKNYFGSDHGIGCPGIKVKIKAQTLIKNGWEEDYEKYAITEEVYNENSFN